MKKYIAYLLVLLCIVCSSVPSEAGNRVFNAPRLPFRKLAKQFNGNADVFTKVDPTPAGTPLTESSATGISGMDGSATVCLEAGFTAPLAVTVFYWQTDGVTAANSCWVRLSNAAAGYTQSVDTNYALINFVLPENTPFLIMTDKSVTGNVYTDARADINNSNSAAGF